MQLPFIGKWMVSQGYNGNITHKGDWSKALDFIIVDNELKTYNTNLTVVDPWANPNDVKHEYNISTLTEIPNIKYDAIILAVGHLRFLKINLQEYLNTNSVIYDVKGILEKKLTDGRL